MVDVLGFRFRGLGFSQSSSAPTSLSVSVSMPTASAAEDARKAKCLRAYRKLMRGPG